MLVTCDPNTFFTNLVGMSRQVQATGGKTSSEVGPIQWMSPENMDRKFSEASDVWAYGFVMLIISVGSRNTKLLVFSCILYELWEGEEPHAELASDKLSLALAIRDQGLSPPIPQHAPQVIQDIMAQCFQYDAAGV